MLELVWAGQHVRFLISLSLEQHVSKYLVHDVSHAVLLGNTTVVLNGQDHWIAGGKGRERERERES